MPDVAAAHHTRVLGIGESAASALAGSGPGRVAAVFTRTLYIETTLGWACLGPTGLGSGPLNVLCDLPDSIDWRATITCGQTVTFAHGLFALSPGWAFVPGNARTWRPDPPPPWTAETLACGLGLLERLVEIPPSQAGLGPFLLKAPYLATPEAQRAAPAVDALHMWLGNRKSGTGIRFDGVARDAASLLGLGPGLTPAGDDFLGGLMIGLHMTGRAAECARLWCELEPKLATRTADISAAHLRAAAAGHGSAALHTALHFVIAGQSERLPGALASIGEIGHTSGWDALAGGVVALRAA